MCFREKLMKKRIESEIGMIDRGLALELRFREKLMKKRIERNVVIPKWEALLSGVVSEKSS